MSLICYYVHEFSQHFIVIHKVFIETYKLSGLDLGYSNKRKVTKIPALKYLDSSIYPLWSSAL